MSVLDRRMGNVQGRGNCAIVSLAMELEDTCRA
jgi:hypothetical protein